MADSTRSGGGLAWLAIALVVALGAATWYLQGRQSDRTTALTKEVLALKKAGASNSAATQFKNIAGQLKTMAGKVSAMSTSMKSVEASVKDLGAKVAKQEKMSPAADIKALKASAESLNGKVAKLEAAPTASDIKALKASVKALQDKIGGLEKMSKSDKTRNLQEQMAKTLADVKKATAETAKTNAAMVHIQKVVDRISAQVKKLEAKGADNGKEN